MNSAWHEIKKQSYSYNDNNKLADILYEKFSNKVWIFDLNEYYIYDSNNNLISWVKEKYYENFWENLLRETCGYDSNNNIIEVTKERWKDGQWEPYSLPFDYPNPIENVDYLASRLEIKWNCVEVTEGIKNEILGETSSFPNPFSETTRINYYLDNPAFVSIDIYNSLGNKIANILNEFKDAGEQEAVFDGSGFPTGVYYYTLKIGDRFESGKLVLIK